MNLDKVYHHLLIPLSVVTFSRFILSTSPRDLGRYSVESPPSQLQTPQVKRDDEKKEGQARMVMMIHKIQERKVGRGMGLVFQTRKEIFSVSSQF